MLRRLRHSGDTFHAQRLGAAAVEEIQDEEQNQCSGDGQRHAADVESGDVVVEEFIANESADPGADDANNDIADPALAALIAVGLARKPTGDRPKN